MCLSPIRVRNRSKILSQTLANQLYIDIPCGKCEECMQKKKDEWHMRLYYEYLSCCKSGGYMLFDTLTYDNKHLPHILDYKDDLKGYVDGEIDNFSTFRRSDIRYFMVRLRRRLSYKGYNVAKNLRYFICSEYGTDERFTHRPHYHVVMFVYNSFISPLDLSRAICSSWNFGRTDGIPFKSSVYVTSKRIFSQENEASHRNNLFRYIAKYIVKNSDYQSVIDTRLSLLPRNHSVRREIAQFHVQSQGFGISAIYESNNSYSYIFENGSLKYLGGKGLLCNIPLPSYFDRKLHYNLVYNLYSSSKTWQLTEKGRIYKENRMLYRESRMLKSVTAIVDNLYLYVSDNQSVISIRQSIEEALDGRSLGDYVDYVVYRRGRLNNGIGYLGSYNVDEKSDRNVWYSYFLEDDKKYFGSTFLSNKFLGNKNSGYFLVKNDDNLVIRRNHSDMIFIDEKFDFLFDLLFMLKNGYYLSETDDKKIDCHVARCRRNEMLRQHFSLKKSAV